ncbi:hypothetical protein UA08_03038 [Talaromyces atroroseus]|uniref:Uncharacterized protein n=1 Tax=Talaromyces atroroseus TaxID=1441469 RepID=A0A225AL95_TALAT|nr:hypothetical protein UA08_03038 [Talaromyces atroroseus]OKL62312.1 hypothetical protein UA08_03038 [Talaromyces atroroseus]
MKLLPVLSSFLTLTSALPINTNSSEPRVKRAGPEIADSAEPYCWKTSPNEPTIACPNGVKTVFSLRCFTLNALYWNGNEDNRSWKYFKCPGLVPGW